MSGSSSVVERNLAKVEVASSTLVSRSIFFARYFLSALLPGWTFFAQNANVFSRGAVPKW
jgi:hypothetical protein